VASKQTLVQAIHAAAGMTLLPEETVMAERRFADSLVVLASIRKWRHELGETEPVKLEPLEFEPYKINERS